MQSIGVMDCDMQFLTAATLRYQFNYCPYNVALGAAPGQRSVLTAGINIHFQNHRVGYLGSRPRACPMYPPAFIQIVETIGD